MTAPEDNSGLLQAADDIRAFEHARGAASRQPEVDELQARITDLEAQLKGSSAEDDRWAVRVFPTYTTKTYGNHAAVLLLLGELGVRRISHLLTPSMSTDVQAFTQAARDQGVLSWLTVGQPLASYTAAQWAKMRALLLGPLRGCVTRVTGFNEPNNDGDPDWVAKTAAHARLLRALVDDVNADYADDGTAPIWVGSTPLWNGNQDKHDADLAQLAPLVRDYVDGGMWHLYFRGGPADSGLYHQRSVYEAAYPGLPSGSHESGAFTAPNYTGGSNPVTEAGQADLCATVLDAYDAAGADALCWFELLDDPDPTGSLREASFGLVRTPTLDPATWSKKPAFDALRDALARRYATA